MSFVAERKASAMFIWLLSLTLATQSALAASEDREAGVDEKLAGVLQEAGFTGTIQSQLVRRLGREIDPKLANLGKLLFFDKIGGLHKDNTCGGCHSPSNGLGDSQSIAIGVQNNGIVGPHRSGPRNQRRTPTVVNNAFYPALMWNGRFSAPSGDPFNNSSGFLFPQPEGETKFRPNDRLIKHLLQAQAFIPPTELVEVAGFTGTKFQLEPRFAQFDDGKGDVVPGPDASNFRNEPIRQAILARLNGIPNYRKLFGEIFPEVATGAQIDFTMFGRAIAEFEFTMVFADAPIDRYARGNRNALYRNEKKGALIFFGKGKCVLCHAVRDAANEMFSDFQMYNIGVPQIAPLFGVDKGNVVFDGPGEDEDFGLEQVTGDRRDRYKFRASPLRNVSLQAAFFHNGAFTRLDDAIRHHLNVFESARHYSPALAGVDKDLTYRLGPIEQVLVTVDPILKDPIELDAKEFRQLLAFVRSGLLDTHAAPKALCGIAPVSVPSGESVLNFEDCKKPKIE